MTLCRHSAEAACALGMTDKVAGERIGCGEDGHECRAIALIGEHARKGLRPHRAREIHKMRERAIGIRAPGQFVYHGVLGRRDPIEQEFGCLGVQEAPAREGPARRCGSAGHGIAVRGQRVGD